MRYIPGLALALTGFWFALSGETSTFFLVVAALSVWFALWVSARLRVLDRDASPYHRLVQLLLYAGWLVWQIIKANVEVIARVLGPRHAIDPAMVQLKAPARTDLGKALFANSITLTPGTVTVDVTGADVSVHALVRENATPASFDTMGRLAAKAADGAERARAASGKTGDGA